MSFCLLAGDGDHAGMAPMDWDEEKNSKPKIYNGFTAFMAESMASKAV